MQLKRIKKHFRRRFKTESFLKNKIFKGHQSNRQENAKFKQNFKSS